VPSEVRTQLQRSWQAAARLADPRAALGAMIGAYVATFGILTWRQQSNFGTFGYDMGIYDQATWLLAHGHSFITVRGLSVWGNHVNVILYLFAPAFWLGAGPHFLYLVETVWLAAGALPLYWLARHRLADPWLALVFPAAYLLYPALEWMNWWHFHPEALGTTLILFAYWFAMQRRWGWFVAAAGAALLCKEDVSFAILVLGLLVAFRWKERRLGLAVAAGAAAWLVLCTRVIIPGADHGQNPFYVDFFPNLGHSVGQIAANAVRHPSRLWRPAFDRRPGQNRVEYYLQLFVPVAFLPVGAIAVLLIGLPQLATNAVSSFGYTYRITNHYHSLIIAAVFLATVEFVGRRRRPQVRQALAGILLVTALYGNVHWSPSPLGHVWRSGVWALDANPRANLVNDALASIPRGGGVSATYYIIPHLTHRRYAYEWPNPFVQANWGIHDQRPPNRATVDYLVIDRWLMGPNDAATLDALLAPAGRFNVVFDRDGVLFAYRQGAALNSGAGPGARFRHPPGDQARSLEVAVALAGLAVGVALQRARRRAREDGPGDDTAPDGRGRALSP
jgi:uncharacterized membrane protein